jgi:hypothetical protein
MNIRNNIDGMIHIICECYICLNTISPEDYDPEVENRALELGIALRSAMQLIFGDKEDYERDGLHSSIEDMIRYVENSQFFYVKDEVVRVLLCNDDMNINALRVLVFCLSRSMLEEDSIDEDSEEDVKWNDGHVIHMNKEDQKKEDVIDSDFNDESGKW